MFLQRPFKKRFAEAQEQLTEKYYAEVSHMYEKMRGWRHDYRHHIQVMKLHMARGEYAEVQRYLEMLDDDLTHLETAIKTGNRMADVILGSKISLARAKQINVKAEAKIPVSLSVSEVDLCILLGNLLDNAIDACMELPPEERLIRIYMEMKGNFLYVSLMNTAAGPKKHTFRSEKGAGHGFGMIRADEIIKKYGGHITRASEDGAFSTELLLPQG